MAESWAAEDLENVELQSFTSSRGSQVHHVRGKHLSLEDVYHVLFRNVPQLNASGRKMLETLNKIQNHDPQLTRQEFPISSLQHVTDEASAGGICDQEGFGIINPTSRPGFRDLSFWSAGVAAEDVEAARQRSFEDVLRVLSPEKALTYEGRLKSQFANSPAFDTTSSRYGNFRFSFPLFYLLYLYNSQHCGGEEPQMRVLGTDVYKKEVAHYILVHGPDDADQFMDLPMVPTVQGEAETLPFVYRRNGMLYWRPESTSSILTAQISDQGVARRECPVPCDYFCDNGYCSHIREENYQVWSAWNHLVFAFHLPNARCLKIPRGQLLENLTACSIDEPALLEESKCLDEEIAEHILWKMKRDFQAEGQIYQ